MTVELYTPGHGLYTDTLILYGLTLPLCEVLGQQEGEIQAELIRAWSVGGFYRLEVRVADHGELADLIASYATDVEDRMVEGLTRGPLGFFTEGDVGVFTQALADTGGLADYLRRLSTPGHAERAGEGREGRGRWKTVKLPLMPMAGKYLHRDLTEVSRYPQAQYKACGYCCALAALGLLEASFPIPGRGREWNRVITILAFDGFTDARYFDLLAAYHIKDWKEFYHKLLNVGARRRATGAAAQLPLRVLMKLVVALFSPSLVRAMTVAQARWRVLGTNLAGRPKAPQVRGYQELEITALVHGLDTLYERGFMAFSELFPLARTLIEAGEVDALESFLDFVASRSLGDLYLFARGAFSTLERTRTEREPEKRKLWGEAVRKVRECQEAARLLLTA